MGDPVETDVPADEDLFYLPIRPDSVTRYTYWFDTYRLDFVFIDELLAATVLTDTELYDGFGHSEEPTEPSLPETDASVLSETE